MNPRLGRICVVAAAAALAGRLPADDVAADASSAIEVRADLVAGEPLTGRLVAVDGDAVRLVADGTERTLPIAAVRQLVRIGAAAATPAALHLTTTDGGTITGEDFLQDGPRGIVRVGGGRIELPIDRVRRVAWLATGAAEPDWLPRIPPRPETDLLVVRREQGEEFVACAVTGVSADHVTVVLDGETIPVKRAKVIGIEWLREESAAGGTVVRAGGGQLSAREVRWSAEAFTVDEIRLPPAALAAIDFAAGRTTPLAGLPLEAASMEPFFGALAAEQSLAAFFAPRTVAAVDGGPASLVVRPRTVATWRVPPESRRFRTSVSRVVPPEAGAAVEVSITVDDRELWRRRLGGPAAAGQEPIVVDLDVAGGRRLTLVVDFVAADMGCGVRFTGGAFEK